MYRLRYPTKFNTKREILWYIRGLKDAKDICVDSIGLEEERYLDSIKYQMDFDKKGKVLDSSVQPSLSADLKKFNKELLTDQPKGEK